MSKDLYSVQLTAEQIECIHTSLSYSTDAIRSQRYDPTDAERVNRQRQHEEMFDSVKRALKAAEPAQ